MQIQGIPVKEISDDFFFCFRSRLHAEPLLQSVQESGILSPLHLDEGRRVIGGFRRLFAVKKIGIDVVPCIVHGTTENVIMIFHGILLENAVHASYTLVEKTRILKILRALGIDSECLVDAFLPVLQVPVQKMVLEEIAHVLDYSPAILDYIEQYDMSIKQCKMFKGLKLSEQSAVMGLADKLQIRHVELGTVLELVRDISGKERISIESILNDSGIEDVLQADLSRDKKLIQLKQMLIARRFPRIHGWNEDLKTLGRTLRLPDAVRFRWDRNLEQPGVEMQASLRSMEDVELIAERFRDPMNRETLQSMFGIIS